MTTAVKNDKQSLVIDYGPVNLKSLIITNDLKEYERRKAHGNIGVLFEPELIKDVGSEETLSIYAIGILADI